MNISINANTKQGRIEFMGLSLTPAEAIELKIQLEWAASAVMNNPPSTSAQPNYPINQALNQRGNNG